MPVPWPLAFLSYKLKHFPLQRSISKGGPACNLHTLPNGALSVSLLTYIIRALTAPTGPTKRKQILMISITQFAPNETFGHVVHIHLIGRALKVSSYLVCPRDEKFSRDEKFVDEKFLARNLSHFS